MQPAEISDSQVGELLKVRRTLKFRSEIADSYLYTIIRENDHIIVKTYEKLNQGETSITGTLENMDDQIYLDLN